MGKMVSIVRDIFENHDRFLKAEVSAEDSGAYCDLLTKLEQEYAQLRVKPTEYFYFIHVF